MVQGKQRSQAKFLRDRPLASMHMRLTKIIRSCALLLLAFSVVSCGSPDSENQRQTSFLPSKLTVTAQSGLVSIEAQDVPLGALLTELGRKAQVAFTIPEEMNSERLTLLVQSRPLEEALRQMFIGKTYTLRYRKKNDREVIIGVDLFARHPSAASPASSVTQPKVTKVNSGGGASFTALERSLKESSEPGQRLEALGALTEQETEESVTSIIVKALSDRSSEVREAALEALKSSLNPVPIGPLASMATQDANPTFRMEAMSLMLDQFSGDELPQEDWDTAMGTLNQALADPDPDVREQAAMLLSNMAPAE